MKSKELEEITEVFELILDVESCSISILDLEKYLHNTSIVFKTINNTYNKKYNIGYDKVDIDIVGLDKGSFKISAIVKKLSDPKVLTTTISTIGIIAAKLISNDSSDTTINIGCDQQVVVHQSDFTDNPKTVNAVSKIAQTAVESEDVRSISMNYINENNELENIKVEKNVLREVVKDVKEDKETTEQLLEHSSLVVISPVLDGSQTNWDVKINGRKISAMMQDENFLKLMDNKNIAFGKGAVIIADLKSIITIRIDGIPSVKHYITKVYKYPEFEKKVNQTLF